MSQMCPNTLLHGIRRFLAFIEYIQLLFYTYFSLVIVRGMNDSLVTLNLYIELALGTVSHTSLQPYWRYAVGEVGLSQGL